MKPTVYIETSVIGHLTSRLPRDLIVAGQMLETRRWWDHGRHKFELLVSETVLQEISRGDPTAAAERLQAVEGIRRLPVQTPAVDLAESLLLKHALPRKAGVDALHLAICATAAVDYLLTWNCRHLANAIQRKNIFAICRASGYDPPAICTPSQLKEMVT